jgi:hypothetical protein
VAGDGEGKALRDDIGFIERLSRLAVDTGQHPVEEIVDLPELARLSPLLDDAAHGGDHEILVGASLFRPPAIELGLDGRFPLRRLRHFRRVQHRENEGTGRVARKGVEPVVESAKRDRVERQPSHVGRNVRRVVRVQPLSFEHELGRDIGHAGDSRAGAFGDRRLFEVAIEHR